MSRTLRTVSSARDVAVHRPAVGLVTRRWTSSPSSASSACLSARAASTPAPRGRTVSAQRPVGGDHPVARHEESDGIPPDRAAHRPRRTRPADPTRNLAVAGDLPARDRPDAVEDEAVPLRAIADVHRDRRRIRILAGEHRSEDRAGAIGEVARLPRRRGARRHRGEPAPRQAGLEPLPRAQQLGRDDAARSRRDMHRAPGRFGGREHHRDEYSVRYASLQENTCILPARCCTLRQQ